MLFLELVRDELRVELFGALAPSANREEIRIFLVFRKNDTLILVHVKELFGQLLLESERLYFKLEYLGHVSEVDAAAHALIG